ncbi:MAG: hypothetical protein ACRDKJ_02045 [Actinomycetota bacterium]
MGWRVVRHIRTRLRELPNDKRNLVPARNALTNAKSLYEVVQIAGYKLDASEVSFFKAIPPLIDSALRGAIIGSVEPSNRSRINFDVAYLAEGSGYSLTISAPKRTGDVDVVLQAPAPQSAAPTRSTRAASARRPRAARPKAKGAARGRTGVKRKPAARKRRR